MHKTAFRFALALLAVAALAMAFRAYFSPSLLLNLLAMSSLC